MHRLLSLALLFPTLATAQASAVDVQYPSGDVTIAATLHLPAARTGPVPAIVFIHGSEGMPRSSGHYLESARWFTSLGYAVLLWDKRGVGGTPGTYQENRALDESARDVVAGVEFLRTRPEIKADRIAVYGVSQGGWIGPVAATLSPHIAFVVVNSGPAGLRAESDLAQRANEWIEDGYTPADTAEIKRFLRITWAYYGTGRDFAGAAAARAAARERPWFKALGFSDSTPRPETLTDPRYDYYRRGRFVLDTVLAKLRVPVLALFGDKDRHIDMPNAAARFEAALREARHPDFTVRVYEGAGHGINVIPEGEIERLRLPPGAARQHRALHPEFRPYVAAWLRAHLEGIPPSAG